jgi:hypothetical protein
MPAATLRFDADVWLHPGEAGWHFVTLPADVADEVRARTEGRPFGTVPVTAAIGSTAWPTSLFADARTSSYLLPLKADVRRRAGVGAGDRVTVALDLRD